MSRTDRVRAGLGLAAFPLALLAQTALDRRVGPAGWTIGAVVFALAGIAFTIGFGARRLKEVPLASPQWHDTTPLHRRWLLLGLNLTWLAFFAFKPNRVTFLGALAWTGALVCVVWMATGRALSTKQRLPIRLARMRCRSNIKWAVALFAITLLAAFFRFHRLDNLPAEMGLDPPYIYLGTQAILQGDRPIFVTLYPGRESGFFYLVAGLSQLFGLSFLTLKATSALIGTLTVPALFFLGRRLFDDWIALGSAALLAVNRWHVLMSRTGLRPVLMPLVVIGLLWTMAPALRRGRWRDFALVGLVLGMGTFAYTGALFLPLVAGTGMVLYPGLLGRVDPRHLWRRLGLTVLVALIVVVPLLRYAITAEDNTYLSRFERRVTGRASAELNLVEAAWTNAIRTVGAFNWQGDNVYAFNLPYKRHMGWVSAALLILGLIYAVSQLQRGPYALLLFTLAATSLPTFITFSVPQEVPNSGRLIGATVSACLLAALPLGLLRGFNRQPGFASFRTAALTLIIVVLLAVETRESYLDCFSQFEQVQPYHNMAVSATVADLIDGFASRRSGSVYVVFRWDAHRGYDFQAVEILSASVEPGWQGFIPVSQVPAAIQAVGDDPAMFILHRDDKSSLSKLQGAFPNGRTEELFDPAGQVALRTFIVDRRP